MAGRSKRHSRGFPRRTFTSLRDLTSDPKIDAMALSPKLVDQLMKHFGMTAPLYHYPQSLASQVLGTRP